jgi:hypothetical protein
MRGHHVVSSHISEFSAGYGYLTAKVHDVLRGKTRSLNLTCDLRPEGTLEVYVTRDKSESFKLRVRRGAAHAEVDSAEFGRTELNLDSESSGGSLLFKTGDDLHKMTYEVRSDGGHGMSFDLESPYLPSGKFAYFVGDSEITFEVRTPFEGYESLLFSGKTSGRNSLNLAFERNGDRNEFGYVYDLSDGNAKFEMTTPVPAMKRVSARFARDLGEVDFTFEGEGDDDDSQLLGVGLKYDFHQTSKGRAKLVVKLPGKEVEVKLKMENWDFAYWAEDEVELTLETSINGDRIFKFNTELSKKGGRYHTFEINLDAPQLSGDELSLKSASPSTTSARSWPSSNLTSTTLGWTLKRRATLRGTWPQRPTCPTLGSWPQT